MALASYVKSNIWTQQEENDKRSASVGFFYTGNIALLKKGIWLYFILLIFEGALRKWVFPSFSNQLLLVREPVAAWLLLLAYRSGIFPRNGYVILVIVISLVSILTAMLLGHGNLIVALYGARIFLLHFPLIFIVGKVFTPDDVIKVGRVAVYLTIPMTVLIFLQFYSPQSAWVNRAVGGEEGGGFSGALGYLRPPGTFSFTNGNTLFYSFVLVFVCYFWRSNNLINKLALISATIGVVVAIPLSISRHHLCICPTCFCPSSQVVSIYYCIIGGGDSPFSHTKEL